MLYRVAVTVQGVLQVEADSPEMAEQLARSATPTLQGKKIFGSKTTADCLGPSENVVLDPNKVVQITSNKVTRH